MNFSARGLAIPDVLLITARRFEDARGYFMETYCARLYEGLASR